MRVLSAPARMPRCTCVVRGPRPWLPPDAGGHGAVDGVEHRLVVREEEHLLVLERAQRLEHKLGRAVVNNREITVLPLGNLFGQLNVELPLRIILFFCHNLIIQRVPLLLLASPPIREDPLRNRQSCRSNLQVLYLQEFYALQLHSLSNLRGNLLFR